MQPRGVHRRWLRQHRVTADPEAPSQVSGGVRGTDLPPEAWLRRRTIEAQGDRGGQDLGGVGGARLRPGHGGEVGGPQGPGRVDEDRPDGHRRPERRERTGKAGRTEGTIAAFSRSVTATSGSSGGSNELTTCNEGRFRLERVWWRSDLAP